MMGVYIKGMEMPSNCEVCPLNYDSIDCMVADNALRENGGDDFLFHHERHPNCPLVPVPPHGDLIGREWLIDIALHLMNTAKNDDIANGVKWLWQYIIDAPAIIPAEEGE